MRSLSSPVRVHPARLRAFSLVELLVVLIVLAVVAAIVWAGSQTLVASSEQRSAEETAGSVGRAVEQTQPRMRPTAGDVAAVVGESAQEQVFGAPGGGRAVVGADGCADFEVTDDGRQVRDCRDLVAVATDDGGETRLRVVDVTDVGDVEELGSVELFTSDWTAHGHVTILDGGDTALVTGYIDNNRQWVATVDLSDPEQPAVLDEIVADGSASGYWRTVVTDDERAALAVGWSGSTSFYDITDRSNLQYRTDIMTPAAEFPTAQGQMFIGRNTGSDSIRKVDASDPANPISEATAISAPWAEGIGASPRAGVAYLLVWDSSPPSLLALDTSEPDTLTVDYTYELPQVQGATHRDHDPVADRSIIASNDDGAALVRAFRFTEEGAEQHAVLRGLDGATIGNNQDTDFVRGRLYVPSSAGHLLVFDVAPGREQFLGRIDSIPDEINGVAGI